MTGPSRVGGAGARGPAAGLSVLGLMLLPACGVPTGSTVHTIDPAEFPPTVTLRSGTDPSASVTGAQAVYFCDGRRRLVSGPVQVPSTATDALLQVVLDRLAAGPSTAQIAQGFTTELPPGTTLRVLSVQNGQATLALGGDQLPVTARTTAIAQIVLSAASVPGISAVRLTLNGRALEAPLADGALTTRPLTAADYRPMLRAEPQNTS